MTDDPMAARRGSARTVVRLATKSGAPDDGYISLRIDTQLQSVEPSCRIADRRHRARLPGRRSGGQTRANAGDDQRDEFRLGEDLEVDVGGRELIAAHDLS